MTHLRFQGRIRKVLGATMVAAWLICCVSQFRVDHFGPFGAAALLMIASWWILPEFRRAAAFISIVALALFITDVALLHHRVGVTLRAWSPIGFGARIVDVLPSPSARSVVYVAQRGFVDTAYSVYLSDGGLFPQHQHIDSERSDASYPKDIPGSWKGTIFSMARFHYDEDSGRAVSTPR